MWGHSGLPVFHQKQPNIDAAVEGKWYLGCKSEETYKSHHRGLLTWACWEIYLAVFRSSTIIVNEGQNNMHISRAVDNELVANQAKWKQRERGEKKNLLICKINFPFRKSDISEKSKGLLSLASHDKTADMYSILFPVHSLRQAQGTGECFKIPSWFQAMTQSASQFTGLSICRSARIGRWRLGLRTALGPFTCWFSAACVATKT